MPKGPGHIAPLVSAQPSYVTGNLIGLDAVDSARAENSPQAKAKAGAARAGLRPAGTKTTPKSSPRVQSKKVETSTTTSSRASPKTKPSKVTTSSPRASTKSKPKVSCSP